MESIEYFLPPVLCLEDHFDRFAQCAPPAGASRGEVDCSAHVVAGIGNRERQTDASENWKIEEIIANKGDLVRLEPAVVEYLANRRPLVGHSLPNYFDFQFRGTHLEDV